jgi:pilus assembly protein Flp/PilA
MNQFIKSINTSISSFVKEEDGAQVVEYALIIAVISIALVGALNSSVGTGGLSAAFTALTTKVGLCFSSGTCA